jgi:Ca-activated chloride channel family protein
MHFANPSAFWLLPILGLLIALRESQQSRYRATLPYPDLSPVDGLPATWRTRYGRWVWGFIYLGLALGIVALARPQSVLKGEAAKARGIDIMIAIDTSDSMGALDFDPLDRMAAAQRAAKNFIQHRQYDRIGLVAFAGVAVLQCPLTLDYAALLDLLDQVAIGMTGTRSTAIGTAIMTAANHLKKSAAKSKVIILVTDGRSNSGEVDPLTAAKAAAALGIKIYPIGVGKRGESVIPVQDPVYGRRLMRMEEDLDEPTLNRIAQETGGRYYRATSVKELAEIYGHIDRLEKTELAAPPPQQFDDRYQGWLLAAMILLSLGFGSRRTVLSTIP